MPTPSPQNQTVPKRLPPGQQLVAPGKWPIIGERHPASSTAPWTLRIFGNVSTPTEFSLDDLRSLPQTTIRIDIHCVTRWSKYDVTFTGVLLSEVLKITSPNPQAKFASFIARSDRDHSTSLTLSTALELQSLIALDVDGQPLDSSHGGPIRNIVPGRYFYKSVKWLDRIELIETDRLGFWEAESGYHNLADPWTEQRYMSPTIDKRTAATLIASKNFSDQDLRSIDASQRNLENLIAIKALLRDANFENANLAGANFSQANLSNSHFRGANLAGAQFVDTDLEGADLSGADLRGANLTGCSLIGASFCTTEENVTTEAMIDASTTIPESALAPLFPAQLDFVRRALNRPPT